MRLRWNQFQCRLEGRHRLVCEGSLQPEPTAQRYRVRITLDAGRLPQVRVLDPMLKRRADDEAIPHTYDEKTNPRPCLFYPNQWHSSMRLSDTIVPWLLEWLLFYELWHVTGDWEGGGIDHGEGENK